MYENEIGIVYNQSLYCNISIINLHLKEEVSENLIRFRPERTRDAIAVDVVAVAVNVVDFVAVVDDVVGVTVYGRLKERKN